MTKKNPIVRIWYIDLESVVMSVEVIGLGWVLEFKAEYKAEVDKHLNHCFKVRLAEQFVFSEHFKCQTELDLKVKG